MKFETLWQSGDLRRTLTVSQVNGNALEFHVMLDMYYQGSLFWRDYRWVGYFNNNLFAAEDVELLGQMIEERLGLVPENNLQKCTNNAPKC